jgi:hypothetical protein
VANQSFQGEDAGRIAQDDMRGAFVNLFLKGGADKMKPVDALALFYDNLDLTPIGRMADEMIRRMSDRLVAVDLLGPAANLLGLIRSTNGWTASPRRRSPPASQPFI